jgi:hypothetical protein
LIEVEAILQSYRDNVNEDFLLPLIQRQTLAALSPDEASLLDASFRKQSYKITVADSSTKLFSIFTSAILLWCLMLMIISGFHCIPECSSYTEMDIIGKLPRTRDENVNSGLFRLQSRLYENGPSNVVKALRGVRLTVKGKAKPDDEPGNY